MTQQQSLGSIAQSGTGARHLQLGRSGIGAGELRGGFKFLQAMLIIAHCQMNSLPQRSLNSTLRVSQNNAQSWRTETQRSHLDLRKDIWTSLPKKKICSLTPQFLQKPFLKYEHNAAYLAHYLQVYSTL